MVKQVIDESSIPTLEFCSLRQALDWIYHGLKPIAPHHEKLVRGDIKKYGNSDKNKYEKILQPLLGNALTITGRKGNLHYWRNDNSLLEFKPKDSRETIVLCDFEFGRIDWDFNCMFDPSQMTIFNESSENGPYVPAIGEIEIPFKELQAYTQKLVGLKDFADVFELLYENDTVYMQINGVSQIELKKLNTGNAKKIFEYIYKHPNKTLFDKDIAVALGIKWDEKADRLDQIIRNIIGVKSLIIKWFPICKTHEIKFNPRFVLPSNDNRIKLDDLIDEIQF